MKQDFVVLTFASPTSNDMEGPGFESKSRSPSSTLESVSVPSEKIDKVEIHTELSEKEVRDIHRDPQRAGAPVMPLTLIQPLDASPGFAPAANNIAWGVKAVGADTSPYDGSGVTVAVLDTGIDVTHPAFKGVTLVTQDFTESGGIMDDVGHGTHCAGTIFGRDVNGMRIGVARGITRAVIGKVLCGPKGGNSGHLAQAMQWASSQGASIISMSLGIDFPGYVARLVNVNKMPVNAATSLALEEYRLNVLLFERLAALFTAPFIQNTLVIAATGNESARDLPDPYTINLSPPAAAPGIIGVAALGQKDKTYEVAPFSNTGAVIAGPGVDITSAWPGGGLNTISGTSMATPHVAGVAALWAQKLARRNQLSSLIAQLTASGSLQSLDSKLEAPDVGTGMVQAPQ